jgi:flagellar hook protein FlgE
LNANGLFIEPATGMRVQGYLADSAGTIDTSGIPTDLFVPLGGGGIVRETTEANLTGNLNADVNAGNTHVFSIEVFDSLGSAREVRLTFTKTATNNQWNWQAQYNNGAADPVTFPVVGSGSIQFDANGRLTAGSPGSVAITAADFGTLDAFPSLPFDFDLDFSAMTQLSAGTDSTSGDPLPSDVTLRNQDGFPLGVLESFNISANGQINGVFTNGLTRTIGVVALGTFANVGGLARDGNNLFRETPSSGTSQIGAPQSGGRGTVTGGVLENSNVDLGAEFSNLIITQRGFQANARTITAADTLLQETVNLVR